MKRHLFYAVFCALFCFSTVAVGDTFTDKTAWQDAVCGTVTTTDFGSLSNSTGNLDPDTNFFGPIASPQALAWGSLSQSQGAIDAFSGNGNIGVLGNENVTTVFEFDASQGAIEGFCFQFANATMIVNIYDGTTLVDSFTSVPGQVDDNVDPATFVAWTNNTGANVTRVEMVAVDNVAGTDTLVILDGELAYGDGCNDPADPHCLEQLEAVVANLTAIPDTGDCWDDYLVDLATAYLECATHPSLWIDGDTLANGSAFFYAKKATKFLKWASDTPEIDAALNDIQAALSCVVELEIETAIAAGGDACDIAWAQYYFDQAEAYAAAGHYRYAVRLRKWAWLCARGSY